MASNLKISIEPGFVMVRVAPTSSVSSSSVHEFFTMMTDAARNADVGKILCDARSATGDLCIQERFDYASLIAYHFRGLKIAFVAKRPLLDPGLFGETVAVNRGGDIRVVETLEEACEWLGVAVPCQSAGSAGK